MTTNTARFGAAGYGDKVSVTTEGRILAMILMVSGVGICGGLGGLAAPIFLQSHAPDAPSNRKVFARLDAFEAKPDALGRGSGSPLRGSRGDSAPGQPIPA